MRSRIYEDDGTYLAFKCPGCKREHMVRVKDLFSQSPHWSWNESLDLPTLYPSVVVRTRQEGDEFVCHSWVKDGRIQFLDDSTHALVGITIDLPRYES